MGKITEEEANLLAQKFAEKLQQARSVSDSVHFDHHMWLTERIAEDKARRVFWERMTEHVVKWGIISVLSALFYALYLGVKAWAKANGIESN